MANEVLWGLANTLIRASALSTIGKLFPRRNIRVLTYILMTLTIILGLVVLMVSVLICRPVTAAWDSEISGQCGNQTMAYVFLELSGALMDVAILIIGPTMTYSLQLPRRKKLVISVLFSLGAL